MSTTKKKAAEQRDELISRIAGAFAATPYPGDEHIVYDNSDWHLECKAIRETFRGVRWQDLTFETLLYNRGSLSAFTPAAFCYYLPAYMIACMRHYRTADTMLDNVAYSLTKPDKARFVPPFDAVVAKLSKPQKSAIRAFLEHLATVNPEPGMATSFKKALRSYWAKCK
jgi:hypothetical protein